MSRSKKKRQEQAENLGKLVEFVHVFAPTSKVEAGKKERATQEEWDKIRNESLKYRKQHALGVFTEPNMITVAVMKEDGRKGYSWCSVEDKFYDRKLGNRIAFSRAQNPETAVVPE